jgi:hypothetical protein
MTLGRRELAARRRGELTRERGSRRFARAIDARRRLNTLQANNAATNVAQQGPDLRYQYLTRSHD